MSENYPDIEQESTPTVSTDEENQKRDKIIEEIRETVELIQPYFVHLIIVRALLERLGNLVSRLD